MPLKARPREKPAHPYYSDRALDHGYGGAAHDPSPLLVRPRERSRDRSREGSRERPRERSQERTSSRISWLDRSSRNSGQRKQLFRVPNHAIPPENIPYRPGRRDGDRRYYDEEYSVINRGYSSYSDDDYERENEARSMVVHRKPISNMSDPLIVEPAIASDMTLHMSLPAAFDLKDILEDCAKLRRLGDFTNALKKYESLHKFFNNRYVLVQYGQCLLEAGQHGKLARLSREVQLDSYSYETNPDPLQLNWTLLLWTAGIKNPSTDERASIGAKVASLLRESWPVLDSTEIQVMCLAMALRCGPTPIYDYDHPKWEEFFWCLVDRDMMWEFLDVFVQLAGIVGIRRAWLSLQGDRRVFARFNLSDYLDMLHNWWDTETFDEATSLFLLELMTSLSLLYMKFSDSKDESQKCLERAKEHVERLAVLDQRNLKTRPLLRYFMAESFTGGLEERYPLRKASLYATRQNLDGLFPAEELPIYIPDDDEAPKRITDAQTNRKDAAIKIRRVLAAAQEMGDLEMQTGCLQELLYTGAEDPQHILNTLEQLWKDNGNSVRRRNLHLFRYALARTPKEREDLRLDILSDGELVDERYRRARNRIMWALSTTAAEKEHYERLQDRDDLEDRTLRRLVESGYSDDHRRARFVPRFREAPTGTLVPDPKHRSMDEGDRLDDFRGARSPPRGHAWTLYSNSRTKDEEVAGDEKRGNRHNSSDSEGGEDRLAKRYLPRNGEISPDNRTAKTDTNKRQEWQGEERKEIEHYPIGRDTSQSKRRSRSSRTPRESDPDRIDPGKIQSKSFLDYLMESGNPDMEKKHGRKSTVEEESEGEVPAMIKRKDGDSEVRAEEVNETEKDNEKKEGEGGEGEEEMEEEATKKEDKGEEEKEEKAMEEENKENKENKEDIDQPKTGNLGLLRTEEIPD